jgi:hypothetical protein
MNNIFCQEQLCNNSEACEFGCGWELGSYGDCLVLFLDPRGRVVFSEDDIDHEPAGNGSLLRTRGLTPLLVISSMDSRSSC